MQGVVDTINLIRLRGSPGFVNVCLQRCVSRALALVYQIDHMHRIWKRTE